MMNDEELPNELAEIATHEFREGDRVQLPIYGGKVVGLLKFIDLTFRKKRYKGLVLISEKDQRCYEFDPALAQRVD